MTLLFVLLGCYQLDGFFFNPDVVDAYTLGGTVIPSTCQELVSFDGEGGTLYGAWAHQPLETGGDCEAGAHHPTATTVIFFHGNAENIDGYWEYSELIWSAGYEALNFDYRGYGRSAGSPTFDGVIDDGAVAIEYASAKSGRGPEELVHIGLSLGGFVAVHNLKDGAPSVLITMDMFASTQKILDDGTTLDLPAGWFFEENFDNLAPLREMPAATPYLVVHGANDTYIQPEHARLVYAAAASTDKSLELIEGADHADAIEVAPKVLSDTLTGWIDTHLAPG